MVERREHGRERRRGSALLAALVCVLAVVGMTLAVAGLGGVNAQRASADRAADQLLQSARTGVTIGRLAAWDAYLAENGGKVGTLPQFRAWITARGLADGRTVWADPATGGLRATATGARVAAGGAAAADVEVTVRRVDRGAEETFLTITARSRSGIDGRTAETVIRVGRRRFEGFRYALFAGNLDRALTNATFDDVQRVRGGPGPYERVKVGSMETIRLDDDAKAKIAGTLYTNGAVLNEAGAVVATPPSSAIQSSGVTLEGEIMDGPPWKDLADGSPTKTTNSTLYSRYSTDTSEQFDGYFPPGGVPAFVKDDDADGVVSGAEWADATSGLTGQATGVIINTADGTVLGLPVSPPVTTLVSNTLGGMNSLMIGTAATPIHIEGDVVIDGDLAIMGPVTGNGRFIVRGNIYFLGDTTYADGPTFGQAPDGTTNAVGYVAQGNIVVGPAHLGEGGVSLPLGPPLLAPRVTDSNLVGPTGQEIGAANRMEWTKTQPYYDPANKVPTSDPAHAGTPNPAYVDGYVPRYYTMTPSGTPQMTLGGQTWDNVNQAWIGPAGEPDTKITSGTFTKSSYLPDQGWIPSALFDTLFAMGDLLRLGKKELRIDGLLYTPNGVLISAPTSTAAKGNVTLNGGIVAGNFGVNADKSFRVNYDQRVRELITVDDDIASGPSITTCYRRER